MTDREDLNRRICKELEWAMDRNPGLSLLSTLDLAVKTICTFRDLKAIPNSELLDLLVKYNRLRDRDASRYHVREVLGI